MAATRTEQQVVREWREIRATHARTVCELDRELQTFGLGASDFEVLDLLAAEEKLRMQDLACQVHLSQSALSRLVARLEKSGLVERGMCPLDRRGVSVCLTDEGRGLHARALPVQRAVLERAFGSS
ncbi:MarR family winged helix-turn-helix transcriptional regulator [Streptomyces polyrhachis]|uniref:MarR family winged helix-turn-helix transcriptional regulator n=1 Tax=Streptomyces polyrhachis TaxID=1282885 RepID=A0ABW2GA41_9ACTN